MPHTERKRRNAEPAVGQYENPPRTATPDMKYGVQEMERKTRPTTYPPTMSVRRRLRTVRKRATKSKNMNGIKMAKDMSILVQNNADDAFSAICQKKYEMLQPATKAANSEKKMLIWSLGLRRKITVPRTVLVIAFMIADMAKYSIKKERRC